jgi:hypothetical protein
MEIVHGYAACPITGWRDVGGRWPCGLTFLYDGQPNNTFPVKEYFAINMWPMNHEDGAKLALPASAFSPLLRVRRPP